MLTCCPRMPYWPRVALGRPVPLKIQTSAGSVQPLLLAALNVDPPEGSAGLAGAIVRETLLAGGQACRPLIARDGLSSVLIEPAIKLLQDKGATIGLGHELREFVMSGNHVGELKFGDDTIAVAARTAPKTASRPAGCGFLPLPAADGPRA